MKGNSLKIIFVIDESGSMQGSESDVIGGFNSYVERHRNQPEANVNVSLYKFSDKATQVFSNKSIAEIKNLSRIDYVPNGFTALFDTIGLAIQETDNQLAAVGEIERPDKVIMIIITDGQENASKEFTGKSIKTMIATHEKLLGWEFIYLGVELENFNDAQLLGIEHTVAWKKTSYKENFNIIAESNIGYCMSDDSKDYNVSDLLDNMNKENGN